MLEVEVLEVGHNTLTQTSASSGPARPALSVIGAAGVPGQLTGTEAKNFSSGNVRLTSATRCSRSTCASRPAAPTCSPTRASA